MIHPIAQRLRNVAGVTEVKGGWVKGYMIHLPKPCFELSFEQPAGFLQPTLPGTQLTYVGMWCGKRTLFEFQLGQLVCIPDDSSFDQHVSPLLQALSGYRHLQAHF